MVMMLSQEWSVFTSELVKAGRVTLQPTRSIRDGIDKRQALEAITPDSLRDAFRGSKHCLCIEGMQTGGRQENRFFKARQGSDGPEDFVVEQVGSQIVQDGAVVLSTVGEPHIFSY